MDPLNRRQFIERGSVVAGALGAASLGWPGLVEKAFAARAGLSASRRRIYSALVEAVGTAPGNQVQVAQAARATNEFASDYADRFPEVQRHIDSVLDAIESAAPGGSFSGLSRERRLAFLRSELRNSPELASQAIELAATPFYPDPEIFHPSPVVI